MTTQYFCGVMDGLLDKYSAGYVEVGASVSIQLVYLVFGIVVERVRGKYSSETTWTMMAESLRNHVVATAIHILYVNVNGGNPALTRTYAIRPYQLPSWEEFVAHLAIGLLLRDFIFYFIHRFWHIPSVYKAVHSKHHEIIYPTKHNVLTISYMGLYDFLFLYGMPVIMIAKVLEMNLFTTMMFSFVSAVGEQFKLMFGDEGHDEHHLSGKGPYGVYGVSDTVFEFFESQDSKKEVKQA
ncbi:sterol desaturase [Ophiostoma piceae UAMH 11346]|uniref:Sterol desaturase n=1 Tax=Ophiostoma piceae (strain UAMH 11346) TaxID=1262450 RepID=S3CPM5_OPHP1|nr:sterol desaturase [Ophiostoma piceae UAMH 11346]